MINKYIKLNCCNIFNKVQLSNSEKVKWKELVVYHTSQPVTPTYGYMPWVPPSKPNPPRCSIAGCGYIPYFK